MSPNAEQLTISALKLNIDDRMALADRLVESLDPLHDDEFRALWIDEAVRRRDAVREGRVVPVDGAEALASVRRIFER